MSHLWEKDLYIIEDYDYIISKPIVEFDMKSAGFNLIQYYSLLSEDKINYLSSLPKYQQTIQIGKYMRSDKDFNKNLTKSFGKMRKLFIEANGIDDSDILSIKKDALFIINKECSNLSYGNVTFAKKNVYSSWHRYGNVEMYYNGSSGKIDIKGISDSELDKHEKTLKIFKKVYRLLENNDTETFIRFFKKFILDYKQKNLSYEYYREFNSMSMFSICPEKDDSLHFYIPNIVDHSFDDLIDISYNYIVYYLPILQRFYFSK